MATMKAQSKNWYYTILAVAKRELGLDEDQYRDMLSNFGAKEKNGKVSASTMTIPQLARTLAHMKSCGFTIKTKKTTANFKDGQLAKCRKIWELLHTAGVMRESYSEAVLTKYAFRMTGVNNIKWATPTGLANTIEALKATAKREGVSIES